MDETFSKSEPKSCEVLPSAISSLELESGAMPCDSPAGTIPNMSGQDQYHVSRFRARDSKKAMPINDTCGPLFTASSPSAALQWSLGNRLRANLDVNGSLEYELTWKEWDMPAGPPICALRASVRRTQGNVCIGVPTPCVPKRAVGHPTPLTGAINEAAHNATSGTWKTALGRLTNGSKLSTGGSSAINPAYPCWLMGLPTVWESCADMVTRSSRRKPKHS